MTAVVGSSCMARPSEEQGGCRDFFQFLCRLAPLSISEGREPGTYPTGSSGGATLSRGRWAAHLGVFWSTIRGSHERTVADRRRLGATRNTGSPSVPRRRPLHRSRPHGGRG